MAQSSMEPMTARYRLRECSALLVVTLCVVVLLSLLSYSPFDFPVGSASDTSENLIGIIGAALSFSLYWSIGGVAYLLPVSLLVVAGYLFFLRPEETDWQVKSLKAGSVLGIFICSATLLHMHGPEVEFLPSGPGGNIGGVIVFHTIHLLDVAGLTILTFVLLLMCLQGIFMFSWLNVLEVTGKGIFAVGRFTQEGLRWLLVASKGMLRSSLVLIARVKEAWSKRRQDKADTFESNSTQVAVLDRPPVDMPKPKAITLEPASSVTPKNEINVKRTNVSGYEPTVLPKFPSFEILSSPDNSKDLNEAERQSLIELGERLRQILADYKVSIEVESIITGPVVSRFEIQLAPGSKVNKITQLANDLAREIAVGSVRVVPVIPGKSVVGIEIPNRERAIVSLREVLAAKTFVDAKRPLTLALGKDIAGEAVYTDIERMPHLLVAGTTGSGKSVGINTMLLSLLYRLTPEDVRMIMIDPKMLELSVYEGIPHLLTPVVTDMQDAAKALQWCVGEMERRYRLMREIQVRNLGGLNEKIDAAAKRNEMIPDPLWDPESGEDQQVLEKLPLIVVIIDEFADMIMIVGKKIEQLIARIAQKARAAGIHLVLATQRPSVDVITGLIKANIPCRISYKVSSQVDSRTILDQVGAEQLLGHGDMLYLAPGSSVPERVHGAFVSDEEVLAVIEEWRQRGTPDYVYDVVADNEEFDLENLGITGFGEEGDDLYEQAVRFVLESNRASASALQTKFQIGWNKAARFMDQMESQGIVSSPDQNGRRAVLKVEE